VCVLSATGSVSRVVLRHPGDASPMTRVHSSPPYKNPAIYEGFYEILSLTGSYNLAEGSQQGQQQSGGLSVTLCSPERNVIGGVLGGQLVAASTVQVPFQKNILSICLTVSSSSIQLNEWSL